MYLGFEPERLALDCITYKELCGYDSLYKVHKMDNPAVTGMSFLYIRNLVYIIPSTKYIKMDNSAVTGMSFLLD